MGLGKVFNDNVEFYIKTIPQWHQILTQKKHSNFFHQLWANRSYLIEINPNFFQLVQALLFGAFLLTMARFSLNHLVEKFIIKPKLVLAKKQQSFTESLWNLTLYSITFFMSAWVVHSNHFLHKKELLWNGYGVDTTIPWFECILYYLETCHYLHLLYAVCFINERKQDSMIMFFHHISALILLTFSYLTRAHKTGIVVLYLHDVCDISLEVVKCFTKLQLPVVQRYSSLIRTGGFLMFLFCWFFFRLYLFPVVVLDPIPIASYTEQAGFPYLLVSYSFLWFIYALDIYWATLIIKLVISVTLGKQGVIDDIREFDENQNSKKEHSN